MAVWGMDVESVKQFAAFAEQKAGTIESVITEMKSALEATEWVGPDFDRFRNEWDSQYSQQLRAAAEAMRSVSQVATQNAEQQTQASST
jgi:hypothetical protein